MQSEEFNVANVKCGGCAAAIRNGLLSLPSVIEVEVDIAGKKVTVKGTSLDRDQLAAKLNALGYPGTDV